MALLELQKVNKRPSKHGGFLDDISIALAAGQICAILGSNGAGKTTLIKAILGLSRIDRGAIHINGRANVDWRARRGVAYLPEQFRPPYYLCGADYLRAVTRLAVVDYDEARVLTLCDQLALPSTALNTTIRSYSKGMGQKLGLIGTFLCGTSLMVLDEPMSGLDVDARIRVRRLLNSYRESGRGILMTTHLLDDVETLSDIVAVIEAGSLLFFGTADGLLTTFSENSLEQAYLACIATSSATGPSLA